MSSDRSYCLPTPKRTPAGRVHRASWSNNGQRIRSRGTPSDSSRLKAPTSEDRGVRSKKALPRRWATQHLMRVAKFCRCRDDRGGQIPAPWREGSLGVLRERVASLSGGGLLRAVPQREMGPKSSRLRDRDCNPMELTRVRGTRGCCVANQPPPNTAPSCTNDRGCRPFDLAMSGGGYSVTSRLGVVEVTVSLRPTAQRRPQ